jgi:rRNA maturation RNase YbeY
VLGDVVISLDTAARQAAERGHSLLDECRVLMLHGVLHLVGFDHEEGENAILLSQERASTCLYCVGMKGAGDL